MNTVYLFIFCVCAMGIDIVTGIYYHCIYKKEKFKSNKLKTGFIEKGIELSVCILFYATRFFDIPLTNEIPIDRISIGFVILQELLSVWENTKHLFVRKDK